MPGGKIGPKTLEAFARVVDSNQDLLDDIKNEWSEIAHDPIPEFNENDAVRFVKMCYTLIGIWRLPVKVHKSPFAQITRSRIVYLHFPKITSRLWLSLWGTYKTAIWGRNAGLKCTGTDVGSAITGYIFPAMSHEQNDLGSRIELKCRVFTSFEAADSYWFPENFIEWCIFYQFLTDLNLVRRTEIFDDIVKGCRAGIFAMLPLQNKCIIVEPPTKFEVNDEGRIHCENGPAVRFKPNVDLYYLHGIPFDKKDYNDIVDVRISGEGVLKIRNVEQRMAAIKHLGYEHILKAVEARVKDTYEGVSRITGKPVKYDLLEFEMTFERFRVIRVEDHTTHHPVTLEVPIQRSTETCLGAIAWTFGMTEDEYKPFLES
jgi:hypothetical protein